MNQEIKNVQPIGNATAKVEPMQTPPHILTGNDAFISSTVARQPKEPKLRITTDERFSPYELPKELQENTEVMKMYRFKWVGKSERQITRATEVENWVLCTRQNAPFIPSSYFKVHGAVEKAGMLLAFQREEMAQARNERLQNIDAARYRAVKGEAHKAPNRYKAGLSPSEAESEPRAGEYKQGRDFV